VQRVAACPEPGSRERRIEMAASRSVAGECCQHPHIHLGSLRRSLVISRFKSRALRRIAAQLG
jgi:hypothetical protein